MPEHVRVQLLRKNLVLVAAFCLFHVLAEDVGNAGSCKRLVSAVVKQRALLAPHIKQVVFGHVTFQKISGFGRNWNVPFLVAFAGQGNHCGMKQSHITNLQINQFLHPCPSVVQDDHQGQVTTSLLCRCIGLFK